MSQDLVPHGSDGTSEPGANSKSGPCAMVDGFCRMLGSWKREGYRLKFTGIAKKFRKGDLTLSPAIWCWGTRLKRLLFPMISLDGWKGEADLHG